MTGGDRIKVAAGSWPKRVGCVGVVVDNPHARLVYPWAGLGNHERVVLLDDDPLDNGSDEKRTWSCVYWTTDLVVES